MVICYAISSGVQSLCSTTITISVMLYVLIPGWVACPGELVSFTCTVICRELLSAGFTWYNSIPTCTLHVTLTLQWAAPCTGWCCGALYTACAISPHAVLTELFWSATIIMYIVWVDVFTVTYHDIRIITCWSNKVTQDSKMELLLRSFPTLLLKVLSVWKSWSITKHTAIYSTDVFVEAPDNFIAHHW